MHPFCGAGANSVAMLAMGLRKTLSMFGRGVTLFLRKLCMTFHAAFVGSFSCGVRLGRFLR